MTREITCTVCPRGCAITVSGEGENVTGAEGYGCGRGYGYACAEFAHPVRILTSTVLLSDGGLLPVRSAAPVPKEKLFACMDCIKKARVVPPVRMHDVILKNVADTGVDIIASKSL